MLEEMEFIRINKLRLDVDEPEDMYVNEYTLHPYVTHSDQ
jgi:hypothetical protein